MREILFKGKDIKGNWHIGLLAHFGNAWYISNSAGVSTAFEVRPETVGQFTGLTDMNGKKIFEGDILLENVFRSSEKKYIVVFRNGAFAYMETKDYWYPFDDTEYGKNGDWLEVIGNIHDTEGGKKLDFEVEE